MTGQQFIDKLTKQMMDREKLQTEYTPADLTQDAAAIGLWYRKPSDREFAQEQDLEAARKEVAPLTEWGRGTE